MQPVAQAQICASAILGIKSGKSVQFVREKKVGVLLLAFLIIFKIVIVSVWIIRFSIRLCGASAKKSVLDHYFRHQVRNIAVCFSIDTSAAVRCSSFGKYI